MKSVFTSIAAIGLIASAVPATAQEAAHDAATLAQAREAAGHILPDGTYARMMEGTFEQMMDQIMASVMDMPMSDIAAMNGIAPEDVEPLSTASMREMMEIIDPHFAERQKISVRVMMGEMVDILTDLEPGMREGLGDAYAARFSAQELSELNEFFATPTGRKYAENSLTIFMDPAFIAKTQEMMPVLMKKMPGIMEKIQAATADLPPARSIDELGEADRAKLAEIFGQTEE